MAYNGLAAFEAEAEHNVSMKVNPCRRAAWIAAVNDAEQAVRVDRLKRIPLMADLYKPTTPKTVPSPKKQKRSYPPRSAKSSAVLEVKSSTNTLALSQDDASPPRKKYRRRKSTLTAQQDIGGPTGGEFLSSAAVCDAENTAPVESGSAAQQSTAGKIVSFYWWVKNL